MHKVLLLLLASIAVCAITEGKPCDALSSQFDENIRERREIDISTSSASSEEDEYSASKDKSDKSATSESSSSSSSSEEDKIVNKSKKCINDPPENKKWEHSKRKVKCDGVLKVKKQAKNVVAYKGYSN